MTNEIGTASGTHGSTLGEAPGLAIPDGKDGWTSSYKLCVEIEKFVRKKSGVSIYLETIDDVIIALKEMGYVTVSPNTELSERQANEASKFAYADLAEFERIVGYKVNEGFKAGWVMARTMNSQLAALAELSGGEVVTTSGTTGSTLGK